MVTSLSDDVSIPFITGAVEVYMHRDDYDYNIDEATEGSLSGVLGDHSIDRAQNVVKLKDRLDSNSIIQELRFKPLGASRLKIPLCRMVLLPKVRPLLISDVRRLESDFVHGYREGDRVFYVSITDDTGSSRLVSEEIISSWNLHWKHANDAFEQELKTNDHWSDLSGKMFFVWDGNHRHQAWSTYISRLHSEDPNWHFSVDSILLTSMGSTGILINAMNDVNR